MSFFQSSSYLCGRRALAGKPGDCEGKAVEADVYNDGYGAFPLRLQTEFGINLRWVQLWLWKREEPWTLVLPYEVLQIGPENRNGCCWPQLSFEN